MFVKKVDHLLKPTEQASASNSSRSSKMKWLGACVSL